MSSFRFLHAADIHLDSPLRGLSRYEGVPVDEVRLATRGALNNLVDFAIAEALAFVVIAGDLFDGEWDDFSTGLYFCSAMRRLDDAGIEVYLAYGNHDADSLQTKRLPLPSNVHVFSHRAPQTMRHEATGAALHGQSYKSRDPGADLSSSYPSATPGLFNIGVLHTALEGGRAPHASYSPCTPAQLAAKGYSYWALGHVHNREVVTERPHVVFPGNIQGRNIRECGPKGAYVVNVEHGEVAALEFIAFDTVRWSNCKVDAARCIDQLELQRMIKEHLLTTMQEEADGRSLIARVTITGQTLLHGVLTERAAVLREEVRALATSISDQIWIEKVRVQTSAPAGAAAAEGEADDITGLLEQGLISSELKEKIRTDFATFFGKIPPDLIEDSEFLTAAKQGKFDALLEGAAASLFARLSEGAG